MHQFQMMTQKWSADATLPLRLALRQKSDNYEMYVQQFCESCNLIRAKSLLNANANLDPKQLF